MYKKWNNILPFQDIIGEFLVGNKGDFTMGFSITTPDAYTLSSEDKNDFYNHINKVLRSLSDGDVISKQDFIYVEKYNRKLKDEYMSFSIYQNELHFDQKDIAKSISYIFITFSSDNNLGNSFYKPLDVVFKKPFKEKLEKRLIALNSESKKISNLMTSSLNHPYEIKRLNNFQLAEYLTRYFNLEPQFEFDGTYFPRIKDFSTQEGFTKIGEKFVSIRSVLNEGEFISDYEVRNNIDQKHLKENVFIDQQIKLPTSLMFPVACGLSFNHILTTSLKKENTGVIDRKLKAEKRWINGMKYFDPKINDKIESIEVFKDLLNENNWFPISMSCNVISWDQDPNELDIKDGIIKSAFDNVSIDMHTFKESFNAGEVFIKSCGGNTRYNPNSILVSNEASVRYFNIEQHSLNDDSGFLYLDRFDNPVIVNERNKKYSNSFNGGVFGGTGSGKTFYLVTKLDRIISNNEVFTFITVKNDLDKFANFYNIPYINTEDKFDNGIDLFFFSKDTNGNYIYDDEHLSYVADQLIFTWKHNEESNQNEIAIIKDSIRDYFNYINESENKPHPTFPHYFDVFLPLFIEKSKNKDEYSNFEGLPFVDFNSFKLVLREYKDIFNSKNPIDIINTPGIIINLGGIKGNDKKFKIYLNDCFYKAERKTVQFQNKRFNTTIIDECFDAFKGRGAENIASKFKKDRSRGSAIIICTQGITELDGIPYSTKKQITDNMYFTVMFNAEDAEIKKELLAFTDFDIKQLSDIHSIEEQYIKIGRGKHGFGKIYKNRVSDLTYAIYTTDSDDVKIINYLKEKNNGSMELAIREFAELRQEKKLKQILTEVNQIVNK